MEMLLDKMILYFHYPFVRYALIVGVLIAFCSSLLGVTLVLKRFSFIRGRTLACGIWRNGRCRSISDDK